MYSSEKFKLNRTRYFNAYYLLKKVKRQSIKLIKIRSRSSVIFKDLTNRIVAIYNGKKYAPIFLSSSVVGYKLGEFVPTRFFNLSKQKELFITQNE